jgi:TP901 family phage tail tape measure protein
MMAEQIRQTLGFDASAAISNLERLSSALSSASNRLTRFGNNVDRFNQRAGGAARGVNTATTSLDRMSQSVRQTEQRIGRLTTSVDLLARIVFTQLVIRGLRIAQQAFFDAASGAAELEVKLAEVQSIAGGAMGSMEELRSAVTDVARELGTGDIEIASGFYQTLSNQVQGTREELIEFNRVAGQFAVAAITSQSDAINLLSGTMNAFNIEVGRAEELSAKFNKAIELGRITGSDLANVLGRVDNQAALLGVTLEELLAAFDTLTISGLKANEAATLLRGIFTGLSKPTEEMKRAFRELGVESGEMLVQSLGLAEGLKALADQTDGTSTSLAKLFPNVRGLIGQLVLAVQSGDKFVENQREIQKTSAELARERFQIIFETDAKQVERALNDLNLELRQAGRELLSITKNVLDFAGSGKEVVQALTAATSIVAGYSVAMLAMSRSAQIAAASNTAMSARIAAALGKVGVATGIVVAAYGVATVAMEKWHEVTLARTNAIRRLQDREFEQFRRQSQERLRLVREENEEFARLATDAVRQRNQVFLRGFDQLKAAEGDFLFTVEQNMKRIVQLRENQIRQTERVASGSARIIEESQRRIINLIQERDQRLFEERVADRAPERQVAAFLSRAIQLSRQASRELVDAANERELEQARGLFQSAQQQIQRAETIARGMGDRRLELRAVRQLNRLTDDQVQAETRLQRNQQRRADSARDSLIEQQRATDRLRFLTGEVIQELSALDDTPDEFERRQARIAELMQEIGTLVPDAADVDLAEALGLTRLVAELERDRDINVRVELLIDESLNNLRAQLENIVEVSFAGPMRDALQDATGIDIRDAESFRKAIQEGIKEVNRLEAEKAAVEERQFRLSNRQQELIEEVRTYSSNWIAAQRVIVSLERINPIARIRQDSERFRDAFKDISQLAKTVEDTGGVGVNQLEQAERAVSRMVEVAERSPGVVPFGDLERATTLLRIFQQVFEGQATVFPEEDEKRLQQLRSTIEDARQKLREGGDVFNDGADQLQRASDDLSATESAFDRGADALSGASMDLNASAENLAAAAQALSVASVSPQGAQFGGNIPRFNSGGFARGRDTLPAMLEPGEFVVNRNASQRFFSDLQRMNAGMAPQFRQAGGAVDQSVTVGDVHVHGSAESMTPRQIAQAVQREIRRNTIRR